MADIVKLIAGLPLLFFLPGALFLRLIGARRQRPLHQGFGEWLFLSALGSVIAASWIGLALAGLSIFSLRAVLAAQALISTFLFLAAPGARWGVPRARIGEIAWIAIFACLGIALFTPPYEYVLGNWDPSTYVNSGARLARSGSIAYRDPVLAALPSSDRSLFYFTHLIDQRYEGGIAIGDHEGAVVSPHFYHIYTVWIALFNSLGNLRFSLWVNVIFGLLALAAFALATRELAGKKTALLAALFMVFSAAEIWSIRFPTAEIVAQFFLWAGLFCLFRYQCEDRGSWAILSGVCFAQAFLSIFTAVIILPLIILIFFWRNWDRWRRSDLFFLIPLAAGLVHLYTQNVTVCRPYVDRQLEVLRSHGLNPFLLVSASVAFILALVTARVFWRSAARRMGELFQRDGFRIALCLLLLCLFVFGYWLRPMLDSEADARNLKELGWFVYPLSGGCCYFPLGLCLALAGALVFVREGFDQRRGSFFIIAAFTLVLFTYKKMIFPSYFWAIRRYIPIVFPSCIFFMAYALGRLGSGSRWRAVAGGAVTLALLTSMLRGYTSRALPTDYAGTIAFLDRLAKPLDRGGLYVCEGSGIASPLDYAYGLDALQLSEQTPEKCKEVERVIINLLDRGGRVYYVSKGGWPISLSLDFVPLFETPLETDHLEYSVGTFPRKRIPVNVTVRVFRVEKIGASPEAGAKSRTIDVGEDCFGLVGGFHDLTILRESKNGKQIKRGARWTSEKAGLVIPTFGSRADLALTIRASGGRNRPVDSVPVRLSINGRKIAEMKIGRSLEEHRAVIPADALPKDASRAILKIGSPTWDPAGPVRGKQLRNLGICIDWLRISPREPVDAL
jgi:hypothetical protein